MRSVSAKLAAAAVVGVLLGCVLPGVIPFVSPGLQRPLVDALSWIPGIDRCGGLSASGAGDDLAVQSVLVASWNHDRVVVRYPPPTSDWETAADGVQVGVLAHVIGGLAGAAFGLGLGAVALSSVARLPILVGCLAGCALGLGVSYSVSTLDGGWPAHWLRGLAGLPGVHEERDALTATDGTQLVRSRALHSSGSRLATLPTSASPWRQGEHEWEVTTRGRAWFAGHGAAALVGLSLLFVAARLVRWRARLPLIGLGLAAFAFVALSYLPTSVQRSVVVGLSGMPTATAEPAGDPAAGSVVQTVSLLGLPLFDAPVAGSDWSWEAGERLSLRWPLLGVLAVAGIGLALPFAVMGGGLTRFRAWRSARQAAAIEQARSEAIALADADSDVDLEAIRINAQQEEMRADVKAWLEDNG